MKNLNRKWVIFYCIIILCVLGGIGILINIKKTYTGPDMTLEMVKTAFLILGGLGVILPTYLTVWQSLENNNIHEAKIAFDKNENAFRLIEKWEDATLLEARRFTRRIKDKKNALSNNDLIAEINGDEKLRESLITVFNYWEQVRISIEYGRANETLLQDAMDDIFLDMYVRFEPWILTRSQTYQNDAKKLYLRWRK